MLVQGMQGAGWQGVTAMGGLGWAPRATAAAEAARGEAQTSTSLEVVTDDGDRVSISLEASRLIEASVASARGPGAEVMAGQASMSSSLDVSVSVEGTLDQEELLDLKKLLLTAAGAMRDAERGDAAHAAKRMARTASLDSLESFSYESTSSWVIELSSAAISAVG
jgi:hypothetical protein